MKSNYLVQSIDGVVQLIAASYLRHSYYWYVTGRVPAGKDAKKIDAKLITKYQTALSEKQRVTRKRAGLANAKYLRYDNWFIILLTAGEHPIRLPEQEGGEKSQLRDVRRTPIRIGGYSISYRRGGRTPKGGADPKWHAHVRIDERTYRDIKNAFLSRCMHRTADSLAAELGALPFARYAPIRRQLLSILKAINERRKSQNYQPLPHSVLNLRRVPVKAYLESDSSHWSDDQ